jgi:hypothetical protein
MSESRHASFLLALGLEEGGSDGGGFVFLKVLVRVMSYSVRGLFQ